MFNERLKERVKDLEDKYTKQLNEVNWLKTKVDMLLRQIPVTCKPIKIGKSWYVKRQDGFTTEYAGPFPTKECAKLYGESVIKGYSNNLKVINVASVDENYEPRKNRFTITDW